MRRDRLAGALLGAYLLLTACSSSTTTTDTGTTAAPSVDPASPAPGSTSGTEDEASPPSDRGDVLDPAAVAPHGPGIAWQLDDAVLLTSTSGTPLGHLPGWSLDRTASDRLALPVLDGPDGPHALTADGLVPTSEPLPLADRHHMQVRDGAVDVLGPDGAVVTTLELADPADLWVSATGSVVGVITGDHWDVEAGAAVGVPAGCRTADRHTPEAPLLVCDDGQRLVGQGVEVVRPDGTPAGWVTVGTTGDEVLATVAGSDGPALHVGTLSEGDLEVRYDPGVGLFFRSGGDAWVAHLGPGSGLDLLVDMDRTERLRDVPPASDAAMWAR